MKPSSGRWSGRSAESRSSPPVSLPVRGTPGHWNENRTRPLRVSVIIPTLNEASTIEDCLGQFDCGSEFLEIIVVDGGSDDGTPEIVRSCPGARLIESSIRGRAIQMNAGAAASSGDVLLFLHADTRLPVRWRELVAESIFGRGKAGGRFRFDIAHAKRIYRWIARGTNFRSRILGITYGDQAIYTTRETFEAVGGFPGIPVFEDARFADRLKTAGGLDWIDEAVLTSARRWERRGPVRTLLLTWLLRLLYTLFVPPRFLARCYGVVR